MLLQVTWATRGNPDFDRETHCEYSNRRLWLFPYAVPGGGWRMGYYREPDAYFRRNRALTPEEAAWVAGNPAAFQAEKAKFDAWRDGCRA